LAAGEAAAVHCGGGLGRTGTVLACYLLEIDEGLGPEEAVRRVRALRPGSVQTPAQLAAIPSVGRALGPLKGSGYGKTLLVEPGSLRLARDEAS
jgi:hypothetical protein